VFKEYFDEEYELRKPYWNNVKKKTIESDHIRLSAIRWKLSNRQDNPLFWEGYIRFIIDMWSESKIRHINNLIGFMENPQNMKEYFLQEKISYRKDKPKMTGHSSKNKHHQDWEQ